LAQRRQLIRNAVVIGGSITFSPHQECRSSCPFTKTAKEDQVAKKAEEINIYILPNNINGPNPFCNAQRLEQTLVSL
jgi:hypothetical protein